MSVSDHNKLFTLWVDADAIPVIIRDYLLKVSDRYLLPLIFVANRPVGVHSAGRVRFVQVSSGSDVADAYIAAQIQPQDVCITQDIPLAQQVVDKGAVAIHPRGELFTTENIKARLHVRDFMEQLRFAGVNTGGPPALTAQDKKYFADQLDKLIQKKLK